MNADPEVMRFFPRLLTRRQSDQMLDRIRRGFRERGFGLSAVSVTSGPRFIGFVGLSVPTFEAAFLPCVEIGWRLVRTAWGNGYATEAAREALRFGFEDLGLKEVVSFTTVSNVASRRVMERLGMERDVAGDFAHPRVPVGDPLRTHVLYRLSRTEIR